MTKLCPLCSKQIIPKMPFADKMIHKATRRVECGPIPVRKKPG